MSEQSGSSTNGECLPLLYNAAKDGNIERIKTVFSGMCEEAIKELVNRAYSSGATPLIIAARNGHDKCVEYLLSIGAEPSTPGTVSFDGDIISRVPPLWAAAAAGHIDTCKVLVKHNVDVNQPSSTNSTPLRGACYDGHLEIVKFLVEHGADIEIANRHGHTPLMISCYRGKVKLVEYLISLGADVNRCGRKGNTALHDAAEIGSKPIVEMLLKAGATMQPGECGVTPLLSAAMLGHTEVMPVLFCLANRKEKQDAWKLLGSTMVDRRMDLGSAITCWNNSFSNSIIGPREEGDETLENSIEEFDSVKLKVYAGYTEARGKADVLNLVGDPEAIRMQALIVRERILGESHPETHYYLRYRGAIYLDMGRWDRTFDLWLYIFQLEQYWLEPMNIHTSSTIVAFLEAFSSILDDLRIRPDRRLFYGHLGVTLEQIVVVMERTIYEAERYLRSELDVEFENYDYRDIRQDTENLLGVILQFLHLTNRVGVLEAQSVPNRRAASDILRLANNVSLAGNSPSIGRSHQQPLSSEITVSSPSSTSCYSSKPDSVQLSTLSNDYFLDYEGPFCENAYLEEEPDINSPSTPKLEFPLRPKCPHLKCLVRRLIGIFGLLEMSPLHLACEEQEHYEMKRSPSRFVIEKLIQAGCDPRRADKDGSTALHVLLSNTIPRPSLVKLLLDAGAPLMARCDAVAGGYTGLDMVHKFSPQLIQELRIARWITLKQLAANCVMQNLSGNDSFRGVLPDELEKYITIF